MNSDPEHFEAYFLRADPEMPCDFLIRKNEIVLKTKEGFVPGIAKKSLLAMQAFENRLNEFDYVIRTNLSSFYPFQNLHAYLEKLPKQNCYCGVSLYQPRAWNPPELGDVPFISGAGIIFSPDMVKLLLKESPRWESYISQIPDDVYFGLVFHKNQIKPISAQRWDYPTYQGWLDLNHKIEDYAYHFRAKASYNVRTSEDPFEDELLTLKALLKKYYPTLCTQ